MLNLLFIIGSLFVVTFGVSLIAAYSVTLKMAEDREESIVLAYFRAFKANLRQGLILTIAYAAAAAAVVIDFVLFENIKDNPIGFLIIGIISAVLVFVHFFYVWALAARYHNSIFRHLTNSRSIFVRFFGRSMLCLVLVAFEVWLFFLNSWMLLFIGIFIAPIMIIATKSAFAIKLFRVIEAEKAGPE
ncbi:MAG: YesL family protein [Christensenellales bacterium]